MGCKHLYVFDAGGNNHEVSARCVLDFYIHESKQRMGLGRRLFQHMLKVNLNNCQILSYFLILIEIFCDAGRKC